MSTATLKERLKDDMKTAMRAKDKARLSTIRLIQSAIKQVEVDEKTQVDDTRVLALIDKMMKQRKDAATQYRDAGRDELADKEEAEMVVLQSYLPEPLSDDALQKLIREAISDSGATGIQDMGKVMGQLKPKIQGRADMGTVSQQVKAALSA